MAEQQTNALLSTQKSSGSGLQAILHPLVLLTISDYITRHTLRHLEGPVVGALLGQQNGREITIEHAFECLVKSESDEANGSEVVLLDTEWFGTRLQQMKDVHKVPPLDLVGWFTILPSSGPQPHHLPIHAQILKSYNESAILLGFHPSAVSNGSVGGKLPITIYESNLEADSLPAKSNIPNDGTTDLEMKDGEEDPLKLKFKELSYSVETGEAEMISVDFVAKGGGNATAVDNALKKNPAALSHKGLQKKAEEKPTTLSEQDVLSSEEQELIASLTAKANAIKMLHSRIALLTAYLENLPPSYIATGVESPEDVRSGNHTQVNHSILRSVQAILNRLNLVMPANNAAFEEEVIAEQNDVHLVDLLSKMTQSIRDAKDLGRKFHVLENAKAPKRPDRIVLPGMGGNVWEPSSTTMSDVLGMDLA